jgi:hypothetical protein
MMENLILRNIYWVFTGYNWILVKYTVRKQARVMHFTIMSVAAFVIMHLWGSIT